MGHLQESRLISAPIEKIYDFLKAEARLFLQVELGPWDLNVTAQPKEILRPKRLSYQTPSGSFRQWTHEVSLRAHDARSTWVTDLVDFRLRFGLLGALADDLFVRQTLSKALQLRLSKIERRVQESADD